MTLQIMVLSGGNFMALADYFMVLAGASFTALVDYFVMLRAEFVVFNCCI